MSFIETRPEMLAKLLFIAKPMAKENGNVTESVAAAKITFVCGQAGLWVESVKPLYKQMALVTVRYFENFQIDNLMAGAQSFIIHRIFKSCMAYKKWVGVECSECHVLKDYHEEPGVPSQSFIDRTVLNFLGVLRNLTVRIKSDEKWLQEAFYEAAVKYNDSEKFGCTFDFDEYDVAMIVRRIPIPRASYDFIVVYPDRNISDMMVLKR